MWFPTKEKVEREIDALLTRFEYIQSRAHLQVIEANKFASVLGPDEFAEKILKNASQMIENLYEAMSQVRFGLRPVRDVARDLPAVGNLAKQYTAILDNMEAVRNSGDLI